MAPVDYIHLGVNRAFSLLNLKEMCHLSSELQKLDFLDLKSHRIKSRNLNPDVALPSVFPSGKDSLASPPTFRLLGR